MQNLLISLFRQCCKSHSLRQYFGHLEEGFSFSRMAQMQTGKLCETNTEDPECDTEWANTEHEKDSDQPRLIENWNIIEHE